MGCYTAPLAAAIGHYVMRQKVEDWKNSKQHKQLTMLLAGGSIFGVVDHFVNGELLSFSFRDIMLGIGITAATVLFWAVLVWADKRDTHSETSA